MNISTGKIFPISKFIPISIIVFFLVIYVHTLLKIDEVAHLGMSALYFLAVAKLLHRQAIVKNLQTSILSSFLGITIIILVGWAILTHGESEQVWRSIPLVFGLGVTLLASNFNSLQYWKGLLILFFLGMPKILIAEFYDFSPLTAQVAGLTLWYSSFDVQVVDKVYVMLLRSGDIIGGVKVFAGCSGLESLCYTLGLSVICLLLYPVSKRFLYWLVPIIASIIGFSINVIRVALLAILNAWQFQDEFIYWHEGEGSLIFGMIAVLLFVTFYYFLPQETEVYEAKTMA